MDWSPYYPAFVSKNTSQDSRPSAQTSSNVPQLDRQVEIADIGCGYGGLLFALAPKFPNTLILGKDSLLSFYTFLHQSVSIEIKNNLPIRISSRLHRAQVTHTPIPNINPDLCTY
jgi:tRNA G46 methylase TrmB